MMFQDKMDDKELPKLKQEIENLRKEISDLHRVIQESQSEDKLKVEYNILETIITNLGVGFVVSDATGNIISMNKSASLIHGFTDEKEGHIHLRKYAEDFILEYTDGRIIPPDEWPLARALKGFFVKNFRVSLINHRLNFRKTVSYHTVPIYINKSLNSIVLTITDHTAEEKQSNRIQSERELFEGIFNNIPVMINIYDPELKSHRFNKSFTTLLGWSEEDALQENFMELVYPDPEYRQQVSDYMQTLQTGWKEFKLKAKDGSLVESDWANIKLSDGVQIGIGIDVRERKKAEENIRYNEQRLRSIFDNAALGIVETDDQDRFIRVNEMFGRILGYSKEDLIGKSIKEITYHDDFRQTEILNNRLHSGEIKMFQYEKRYCKKDGDPLWVHVTVSAITSDQGKYIKSIGTIEDISERKQSEQKLLNALHEAEEGKNILHALMENIPLGIAIAEAPEISYRMISQYGLNMFNTNMHDLNSFPFINHSERLDVYHLDGKSPGLADEMPLARAIKTGEVVKNEEWLIRYSDGSFGTINCNAAPILDGNEKIIGGVIAWQDITDLKENEKEIKQKNEELTRFIYTVSHDLKSPLVTIKSFTEYLKEDVKSGDLEAMEKDMAYIMNAADKMGALLDELLELSRIGRKETPKTQILLQEVIQSAVDLVAGGISKRNIKISHNYPPIMLFGHGQRLIQLYQNLIENAVKFMGDQPFPEIEIGVITKQPSELVFYVKDNGSGIDPRYHHKIFGLFEKLSNSTEGSGIGLALVKRIVEIHDGRIWFESEGQTHGTTFYFTLNKSYMIDKNDSYV